MQEEIAQLDCLSDASKTEYLMVKVMKSFLVSSLSLFLLAAPAAAETYDCTFKIPDRYRLWVPEQIRLDDDPARAFGSVRAKLFDRFGERALKAEVVFENNLRKKFVFWFGNSDVWRSSGRSSASILGRTKYELTLYKDGRPALLKAAGAESDVFITEEKYRTTGKCIGRQ
ncbi:hypothetical protein [Aliiroseovarius crassostreae]|uniref:hypothetical protein n=1 Tax=Aliiroseovarius crassostreae TaxID=154981 RepID=UPI0022053EDC|nr:hypothetical protein [Aliiroseovarius crassostreae]UWQ03601.1 hypothetical protein K3X22_07645 [Aliiroseovarius crassostreae]